MLQSQRDGLESSQGLESGQRATYNERDNEPVQ